MVIGIDHGKPALMIVFAETRAAVMVAKDFFPGNLSHTQAAQSGVFQGLSGQSSETASESHDFASASKLQFVIVSIAPLYLIYLILTLSLTRLICYVHFLLKVLPVPSFALNGDHVFPNH